MPGLYKKRKRPTNPPSGAGGEGSVSNNDQSSGSSVWHSTAINTSTASGSGGSGSGTLAGVTPSRSTTSQDEEEDDLLSLSPVKRPTLGGGVLHHHPTPHRRSSSEMDVNSSSPPGPSSLSVIQTPSAAVNLVLEEDGDVDGGNRDLFERMEVEEPAAAPAVAQKPQPQDSSDEEEVTISPIPPRRRQRPEVPPPSAPGASSFSRPLAGGAGGSRSQNLDRSIHLSQRYGPIAIHPPSGHGFFSSTIHQAGFVLTIPKNHLYKDVLNFRNNMEKWMEDNTNDRSRIEEGATKFINAMKKYFSSKPNLIHSCTTTLNDDECIQPSLLTCLLGVPRLQLPLLEVLLPSLSEVTYSSAQEDVDFVATIVAQMKWLPVLVDGRKFGDDLLLILEASSIPAKKHIIRHLPEIFMPEYHPHLVPKLMEIFDVGATGVNVTMLDCFSSLVVPEQECIRIRSSAVEQMKKAPLEELPAYISFMFRVGSPPGQLEEGIREMREKLEIKPPTKKGTPRDDALMVEVLERIRFFVSVNPAIIKIWLTHIKDDLDVDLDLPTIDLLMLLIFVEASNKAALNMLTEIFSRTSLTVGLFDKMMENNNQMLHELFPTIARFLDSILRVKSSKCHEGAGEITKLLFGLGPLFGQHLISNLIGVLINGHPTCRDVVLKVFTSVAETNAPKLLYFHTYLMGALVYVIKYPPRQMQALMNILAILAYMPENINGEENSFTAEFMILLRKQITHGNIRTRCFGVLGTIAAVRQLALNSNEANDSKIDGLLALAWSSIENDEEACSIFFDEMITCINVLPKEVCIQFRDILKMQFERLWTLDTSSDSVLLSSGKGQSDLSLVPTFDGNKELQLAEGGGGGLILVLEPHPLQMSPLVVPSLLRVMAELEKASENGALEGIDSLIGCPVFFPKLSAYYDHRDMEGLSYNQRLHLGQYLTITLNYFRECVSAFVESDNPELRVKVWMRLQNIVTLQKILVKHYESFPNLPSAYGTDKNMTDAGGAGPSSSSGPGFSGGGGGGLFPGAGPSKKAAAGGKKKVPKPRKKPAKKKIGKGGGGKRKKKNEEDDEESTAHEGDSESEQDPHISLLPLNKTTTDLEERIQPKFISSYIRRLDSKVFSLLITFPLKPGAGATAPPLDYTEILRNLSTAMQCPETMARIEQFTPETLTLLLAEMKRQALDKNCDFKLLLVDNLLASLCQHVNTIETFYEESSQLDEDGSPEARMHSPPLDSALRLLLKLLNLYLETVSKVEKSRRKELLASVISTIYSKSKAGSEPGTATAQPQPDGKKMLKVVAKYLKNFSTFVGEEEFETALEHVKLMKTFHDLVPAPEPLKRAMDKAIKSYLRRDWKLPSSAITSFLKTWFSVTDSQMNVVTELAADLLDTDSEEDEDGAVPAPIPNNSVYKSCNKTNFSTWYSAMFAALAQHVLIMGRKKAGLDFAELIAGWSNGNNLLFKLVHVSTTIRKASILIPLLKFSRLYVQAFINAGVDLLPELWKQDLESVQDFTRTLQNSTRKIQHICEHSKIVKDTVLLRNVPLMKKTLEMLVFKVREALGSIGGTGCGDSGGGFWMGQLKIKDLDGKVIGSQPFNGSSDEEDADPDPEESEDDDGGPDPEGMVVVEYLDPDEGVDSGEEDEEMYDSDE